MTEQRQISSYGLHWDGSVAWLCQGRGGNNFIGLKAQCPFFVPGRMMCNHLVPPAAPVPDPLQWEAFMKFFPDPLTQAMLPIPNVPGQNLFFVPDPHDDLGLYLSNLSRLSSPITPTVRPIWTVKIKELEKEMNASNIQPLVLVQADQKQQEIVDTLAQMATYSARTVIVTGRSEVVASAPFQRIQSELRDHSINDLVSLPMESLGATILRRLARKEDLDAPIETRKDRRARQLRERTGK